ncbi:MAG: hypothetical protein U1E10_17350 [Bdellovibrionales bacterium]|nr:hypothetical protein [Bdellovibrionales bacterium]
MTPLDGQNLSGNLTANSILLALALFPLLPMGLGAAFRARQNKGDIVGGDISWPKALWLAYTVSTWFVLPLLLLGLSYSRLGTPLPVSLLIAFVGHSVSWWIRGPLELFMIYKWFNWSPRYGIAHDLAHASFLILAIVSAFLRSEIELWFATPVAAIAALFVFVTVFTTFAETLFAYLFLNERTKGEDLLYFASDEPRWLMINRITTTVVILAYGHLFFQSILVGKLLLGHSGVEL